MFFIIDKSGSDYEREYKKENKAYKQSFFFVKNYFSLFAS